MMKDVKGYEGKYTVSPEGIVWNLIKNREVAQFDTYNGYLCVNLYKDGKKKNCRVHRLVAEAYIPNPEDKPEIDHIDGNRKNNDISNLRWVTSAENKANVEVRGRKISRTPIKCVETGEVFKSMVQAAEWAGIHRYGINCCVLGKQKTAGGYHWERYVVDKKSNKGGSRK